VQCDVCPRACALKEGQRGLCFVRGCEDGAVVLHTYGRSSGFCIDPIEKKPLNHFLPGTPVLSFGTAGCNLTCRFCQNWDMSKSREMDTLASAEASPEAIAEAARARLPQRRLHLQRPGDLLEYACDTAAACRELGIRNVAVTAGYISPGAASVSSPHGRRQHRPEGVHRRLLQALCARGLAPVLETIEYVHHETDVWLELTTLLIPGHNDSDAEIARMAAWVVEHLGPMCRCTSAPSTRTTDADVPPTPAATLTRARRWRWMQGVRYAYTGNVHDATAAAPTATPAASC
jgi:pyruvate formate lyase activating enzyme